MADSKISALTAAAAAAGANELAINEAGTSKKLTVAQLLTNDLHAGYIDLSAIADPAAPGAGILRNYTKNIGGRMLFKMVGPSGLDTALQPALFQNRVIMYLPSTGTTGTGSGTSLGPPWSSNGTVSHPTPSNTAPSITSQMKRTRYANVVTTPDQVLGIRFAVASERQFWRGDAADRGGFYFQCRFIVELIPASTVRIFAGLVGAAATHAVSSNTMVNDSVGLWHDTTDPLSGANSFNLVTRDAATTTKTSIALTNAIAAGSGYDFYMFCAPGGTTIYYLLKDINNNVEYTGSATATLPTNTVFMQTQAGMSNGTANLTVTTTAIGICGLYCESDR